MAIRHHLEYLSFSTQETRIIEFPDIPGEVVQIWRVSFQVQSFTAATAIALRLVHNVNLAVTLAVNAEQLPNVWATVDQAASGGGPPQAITEFWPEPYELLGRQRLDMVSSAGTVQGILSIMYTTRSEPNRTLWNRIRRSTSFD